MNLSKEYDDQLLQYIETMHMKNVEQQSLFKRKTEIYAQLKCLEKPIERQTKTWKKLHIKHIDDYYNSIVTTHYIKQVNQILTRFGRLFVLLYNNPLLTENTFNKLSTRIPLRRYRLIVPIKKVLKKK